MKISRRDFVVQSSGLLFSLAPFIGIGPNLLTVDKTNLFETKLSDEKNILVLIYLAGGNDWFNTVIPYNYPDYYRLRPSIAINPETVLKLDNDFSFHPALTEMKSLYDKGDVAVLLNCGVTEHNLSHHKAIQLMQYADGNKTWQARYAELTLNELGNQSFPTINAEPQIFRDKDASDDIKSRDKLLFSSLSASNDFEFNLDLHYELGIESNEPNTYVEHGFDFALKQTARLITQKTNSTIYNISLGGFDTHANQLDQHAYLLKVLSKGLHSFQSDLDKCGFGHRVLTLICSEFGRNAKENESQGTDHGFINHVLAIGDSVKGGIYGKGKAEMANGLQNKIGHAQLQVAALSWLSCPNAATSASGQEITPFI